MIFQPFPGPTLHSFEAYREEAARAGRNLNLGDSAGTCGFFYIGKDRNQAVDLVNRGSYFVFTNFHSKVDKNIPSKMESVIEAKMAAVGTVDDVRRRLADIQETLNPEYLLWLGDQGYLTLDEQKRELELFASKIMPEFHQRSSSAASAAEAPMAK
jgi:alkanesulfonate monooxygenase SsuD/methylene tetrahydromethanopterin reductase-like flavin-dependent oxidoreductase (luciferase family)